jgi:hypothetical protein
LGGCPTSRWTFSATEPYLISELREASTAHEQQVCRGLSPDEHQQLTALLRRMVEEQELTPGVHPGYRSIKADRPTRGSKREPPAARSTARCEPGPGVGRITGSSRLS